MQGTIRKKMWSQTTQKQKTVTRGEAGCYNDTIRPEGFYDFDGCGACKEREKAD